ncbi:MAG: DUF1449 family protein [Cocleimonas sp.]|nr:DUF1449 family protein [Cocleimonas sp.]
MIEFLNNAFTFPTIFYTGLLALVVLYWLISMFGLGGFDAVETDMEVDNTNGLAGWLSRFRLDGIPLTLSLSLVVFVAWILCFYMVEFFLNTMAKEIDNELVQIALGFWLLILSPALALPIVITLLSPLRPFFKKLRKETRGASANDFIGRTATIRSGKVNQLHGTVELSDGGAGLILQVRAEEPNDYKAGDKVLLKEYLAESHTYRLEAL